ncbi:MAG: glycosyltransferase [Metallosphaera sp.]
MLTVIIPAYNESHRIQRTLKKLSKFDDVIVIFDGNDDTPNVVRKFPVRLFISKERLGKGGALKTGISLSKGDRILTMDADFPVSEEDLKKLLETDADLVLPKRKILGMPLTRRFLHFSFIRLTKLLFPSLKFQDFQSGVKLIRRDKALSVMNELIMNDLLFDVNLIYAFRRRGYVIKEVEISYIHDEKGSKISGRLIKVVLLMFLSLIKLRVYYSPFKSILDTRLYRRAQDFILKVLR